MALHFTRDMLEAGYSLLLVSPPFRGWHRRKLLPPSEEVEFHVSGSKAWRGDCHWNGKRYVVRISGPNHHTYPRMIETMAHEMAHIVEWELKVRRDVEHSKEWHAMADAICKYHGFDRGAF